MRRVLDTSDFGDNLTWALQVLLGVESLPKFIIIETVEEND